jgi:hypothetical protein
MLNWFRQIDDAEDEVQLVAVMRQYFASWTPAELALLPQACRPGRMKSLEDLDALHLVMVDCYRQSTAEGEALAALQRMTSFVVRAAVRGAQLREDRDPSGEPPEGAPSRSAAARERN